MANVELVCTVCGATCTERKDMRRFERRHPALCAERKEYTKQLAQGTRAVEDEEDRQRCGGRERD